MSPAQHSFRTGYAIRIHFELGLNRKEQLVPRGSQLQLRLQYLPLMGFDIVLLGVMSMGVAATLLGLRHCGTGICEQSVRGFTVSWIERYTDAGGDVNFATADVKRLLEHAQYSSRQ